MSKPAAQATPNTSALTPTQAGAHVAVAVRVGDRQRELTARRNLAEARITAAVRHALSVSPALTDDQRTRIAALLRSAGVK